MSDSIELQIYEGDEKKNRERRRVFTGNNIYRIFPRENSTNGGLFFFYPFGDRRPFRCFVVIYSGRFIDFGTCGGFGPFLKMAFLRLISSINLRWLYSNGKIHFKSLR